MTEITSKPAHGGKLINEEGTATQEFQLYLDDLGKQQTAEILPEYTVATLPAAADFQSGMITVSDETGGYVTAFSDGTDWRRTTDRAIVS